MEKGRERGIAPGKGALGTLVLTPHAPPRAAADVENRASREREAQDKERRRAHAEAEHGSDEGRSTTDQSGEPKKGPGGAAATRERRGDAKALGRVVQAKTDDQQGGQLERAGPR